VKLYQAFIYPIQQSYIANAHRAPVRILHSYAFNKGKCLPPWNGLNIKGWALDSGAFTAHSQGTQIDHEAYMEYAASCNSEHIFGLDVIGDPNGTRKNLEREWKQGLNTIPTIHFGQATQERIDWAKSGPTGKIGIGGIARRGFAERWNHVVDVFRMAWPCKIHALGVSDPAILQSFPFDSADASIAMCIKFAQYDCYNMDISIPQCTKKCWNLVAWRQDLERKLTAQWRPFWEAQA
jgi:hypothetical protein